MMTKARPMAMSRSRVQTRISVRKECTEADGSEVALGVKVGADVSGTTMVGEFLSSVLCIFRCLVFISRASRAAPDFDLTGVRLGNAGRTARFAASVVRTVRRRGPPARCLPGVGGASQVRSNERDGISPHRYSRFERVV